MHNPVIVPKQPTLEQIHASYVSSMCVFTDGSTPSRSSAIGVGIPLADKVMKKNLGRVSSSTSTELVAFTEVLFIYCHNQHNMRTYLMTLNQRSKPFLTYEVVTGEYYPSTIYSWHR